METALLVNLIMNLADEKHSLGVKYAKTLVKFIDLV